MGKPIYWDIWNKHNPNDLKIMGDRFVIHHINGKHFDNRPENLQKMPLSEHSILHNTGKDNGMYGNNHTNETKEKIRLAATGRKMSDETRAKVYAAQKGSKRSEESKKRMAEAGKKYWDTLTVEERKARGVKRKKYKRTK